MISALQYLEDCSGDVEGEYADPELRENCLKIRAFITGKKMIGKRQLGIGEFAEKWAEIFYSDMCDMPDRIFIKKRIIAMLYEFHKPSQEKSDV